jgi:ribonuclease T1
LKVFGWLFALSSLVISCNAIASKSVDQVGVAEIPLEAREALRLVKSGGPFRYQQDAKIFGNREGLLPKRERGYYREYTVKTPGARDRGARRIVAGRGGEYYYSDDHYRSFRRIIE